MRRYCMYRRKGQWTLWRDDYDGWNPIKTSTFHDCMIERLKEEGIYIV